MEHADVIIFGIGRFRTRRIERRRSAGFAVLALDVDLNDNAANFSAEQIVQALKQHQTGPTQTKRKG